MSIELLPEWMTGLEEEDAAFIKRFILASGSLKEVAGQYGVTYPTVRLRLDRLIQKNQADRGHRCRPLHRHHQTAGDERKLDLDTAKVLIAAYKKDPQREGGIIMSGAGIFLEHLD